MTYFQKSISSPVGELRFVATSDALIGVFSASQGKYRDSKPALAHPIIDLAIDELTAYFEGKATAFATPIEMAGTAFQQAVWGELLNIPFGETRSYAQIASAIGKPSAVRAVGAANGKNPLGIIVPCHRVIGKNGSLTGYAGGLDMKLWLLRHEGALLM
jgi:methylated-DNA-[protein]-cysteine S-methyltransferase